MGDGGCRYLAAHELTLGGDRSRWCRMNWWSDREAVRSRALSYISGEQIVRRTVHRVWTLSTAIFRLLTMHRASPSCTNVLILWSSFIVWIKTTVTTETEHISAWRWDSALQDRQTDRQARTNRSSHLRVSSLNCWSLIGRLSNKNRTLIQFLSSAVWVSNPPGWHSGR